MLHWVLSESLDIILLIMRVLVYLLRLYDKLLLRMQYILLFKPRKMLKLLVTVRSLPNRNILYHLCNLFALK